MILSNDLGRAMFPNFWGWPRRQGDGDQGFVHHETTQSDTETPQVGYLGEPRVLQNTCTKYMEMKSKARGLEGSPRGSSWPRRPAGTAGGCVAARAGPASCAAAARPPAAPAPAAQTAPGSPVTSQTDSHHSTLLSTTLQPLSFSRVLPKCSETWRLSRLHERRSLLLQNSTTLTKTQSNRSHRCPWGLSELYGE